MASGGTQNASEMAEATQIAKQVQRCKKARLMELRDCELDGEIARLARWRDGGTGACVVPKNAKGLRQESAQSATKRARVASCKEGR